jgi:glutamine synthetase
MDKVRAEYIWIDGQIPTAKMRCKTRILDNHRDLLSNLELIPEWGFDGSSTYQATTGDSDCDLRPVYAMPDPLLGPPHILVMCEVYLTNGEPHPSNTRRVLRETAEKFKTEKALFGIEQEYTLIEPDTGRPLRWPVGRGYPAPQGRYYCGVGSDEVYGGEFIREHTEMCLKAGISLYGTNGEVMPSQWEFQIGTLPPLEMADHLWLARWLMYRLGEKRHVVMTLDPKPISGDWNGAGAHTNFSTAAMRKAPEGLEAIKAACEKLGTRAKEHVQPHVYGADNHLRLTGQHETCDINTFRYGFGDRGASIRIPAKVKRDKSGYLEDRRPAANMDPYRVLTALLQTVCGDGFDSSIFDYFKPSK